MPRTKTKPLPAGSMLAHYRLDEVVGEGAMGTVYKARDEGLDRTVAVKVLRPAVSGMTVRVDRFFREARAAARINHPNLTHVYYVGGDGSYRFFAMEYVHGQDVAELVDGEGRPDLERAIDLLVQAASGLAAAHEQGIVHRDVKPSNILVRPDGTVKITDFGLSKSVDADVKISQDDTVIGTPIYMSPEQCRSRDVDARTDIYCLGLTAWALLVGRPPFPGPSLGDVLHDQINTPLPSLADERPDLPRSLDKVLQRMCAKDPDKRPQSMSEVVSMLEACRPRAVHAAPIVARGVSVCFDFLAAFVAFGAISFLIGAASGEQLPGELPTVLLSVIFLAFTVLAEVRYHLSLGKWFLNLEVRSADGSEPPRRRMWLRGLLRFPGAFGWALALPMIPGLAILDWVFSGLALLAILGGLATFYAANGRTLSDLLTKTRVVYRMPPDERHAASGDEHG